MSNKELPPLQNYVNENQAIELQCHSAEFLVKFWGIRGLIPSPSSETSRYGGNTACVEMQVADKRLVFDGGSGLRLLGKAMLGLNTPIEAHLFFTNSQSNRIQGFPFFAPAFIRENRLHIYGIAALNGASIKQCLGDQMLQPHFPYPIQVMQSELHFHSFVPGKQVKLDDEVIITTALINQTQNSVGYRVTWHNKSVAYLTDLDMRANDLEQENITKLAQGVDLLVANATYIPTATHNPHNSNSYWQTAVDLARCTEVKQLIISHHHPDDDDVFLDKVQDEVKAVFPKTLLAREGLILPID
jgi:phosphoribosyl 1,2-cyclic phosphodiesterase